MSEPSMSPIPPAPTIPMPGSREEGLRKVCLFDYLMHILGLLLSAGLLSVIALIVNYVKRGDARGTIYESHMNWMIATFWWTLFWVVVSFIPSLVLTVVSFGLLSFLFVVPAFWFLYRMVKGLLRLMDNRPVP